MGGIGSERRKASHASENQITTGERDEISEMKTPKAENT